MVTGVGVPQQISAVWPLTVITGADIVNGQAVANDAGDNVYPVYATEGNPPKFIVKGAVPIV